MMLEVMKKVVLLNKVIVVYCEDNDLINKGCVYDGKFVKEYGLNGIFFICEVV